MEMEALEVALGYDGRLRGRPEPVLIVAMFGVGADGAVLLDRALRQFTVTSGGPATIPLARDQRLLAKSSIPAAYSHLVVVGLALEEDGGADVATLYAGMSEPDAILSWPLSDIVPEPVTLAETIRHAQSVPPDARSVQLSRNHEDIGGACAVDDFIGASIIVLDAGKRHRSDWRMHFISDDERNDWTALLKICL